MSVDVAVPAAAFAEDDELPSSELPDDAVIPELSELPDDCAPDPELLSELPELSDELPELPTTEEAVAALDNEQMLLFQEVQQLQAGEEPAAAEEETDE